MNFKEALEQLDRGHAVTRKAWKNDVIMKLEIEPDKRMVYFQMGFCRYEINMKDITEEKWLMENDRENLYEFLDILPSLKQGRKIRRPDWKKSSYVTMDSNGELMFTTFAKIEYQLSFKDICATDWEIVND